MLPRHNSCKQSFHSHTVYLTRNRPQFGAKWTVQFSLCPSSFHPWLGGQLPRPFSPPTSLSHPDSSLSHHSNDAPIPRPHCLSFRVPPPPHEPLLQPPLFLPLLDPYNLRQSYKPAVATLYICQRHFHPCLSSLESLYWGAASISLHHSRPRAPPWTHPPTRC
jgi:hypothetical protein